MDSSLKEDPSAVASQSLPNITNRSNDTDPKQLSKMKKKTMQGMNTYLDNSTVNMSRHKQVQALMNDFNSSQKRSTKSP
jgi:hypothetical protein